MNNIEEYQNLVELLKQALEFYANKDNYFTSQKVSNHPAPSMIQLDGGSQAQFALVKIKEVNDQNQKMLDEYNKLADKADQLESDGETNPIELINVFLQTRDDDNNV